MNFFTLLIAFVVTVLILVTVHEFGHFWVARRLGIKVLRFSIGFGKALLTWRGKGGVEYVLALFPLGGYVRLLDTREDSVSPEERPFAFDTQALWKRFVVVLAGPGINLIFAVLMFWVMFMIGVQQMTPLVGKVVVNSPAAQAGIQAGDKITQIDNKPIDHWQQAVFAIFRRMGESGQMRITTQSARGERVHELALKTWRVDGLNPRPIKALGLLPYRPSIPARLAQVVPASVAAKAGLKAGDEVLSINQKATPHWLDMLELIQANPNKEITLKILRNGSSHTVRLVPTEKRLSLTRTVGVMGVLAPKVDWPKNVMITTQYGPLKALGFAMRDTWNLFAFNGIVLKKLVLGQVSLKTIGGPISIIRTADVAWSQGVLVFINFLAIISVMLAFVNLLPIPGLDGGHLFLFAIEKLKGKPLSLAAQMFLIRLGLIALVMLVVYATINDVMRLVVR